jgi:hypothetical protein
LETSLTRIIPEKAEPKLVAFTAPSAQVMAILDAAEMVRVRLVLFSATGGDQRGRQLGLLAGELRALRQALRDPKLDGRLSCLGSALGLMAEEFRDPGPELTGWCVNVIEVPPRRLAKHLDALANALFPSDETELPWAEYEPAVLEELLAPHLDRTRIARLKSAPLPRRRW